MSHMPSGYRLLCLLLVIPGVSACLHDDSDESPLGCNAVTGAPVATVSADAGVTVLPNSEPVRGTGPGAVHFVKLAANANLLFAINDGAVYRSRNAGCHWEQLREPDEPYRYAGIAGTRDRVFVIEAGETGARILRLDADGNADHVEAPGEPASMATTPDDPDALYLATTGAAQLWRSTDRGETWTPQAALPERDRLSLHLDPRDQLHVIIDHGAGLDVSFDGGATWTAASIPSGNVEETRIGALAFDGANEDIWASVVRYEVEAGGEQELQGWAMARSTDGGLTFHDVRDDTQDMPYVATLVPRPGVAGELYFTELHVSRGSFPCFLPSSRLFRFTANGYALSHATHTTPEGRALAGLLFDPDDGNVLYLGNAEPMACAT